MMLKLLTLDMTVVISGVSERQIHRISKAFEETGNPYVEPAAKSGRRRHITAEGEQVSDHIAVFLLTTDYMQ